MCNTIVWLYYYNLFLPLPLLAYSPQLPVQSDMETTDDLFLLTTFSHIFRNNQALLNGCKYSSCSIA